jgi:hypothetical protein
MLLYLKKKKEDADELKRQRGDIGEEGIRIMNRLSARTDDDTDQYNANVVPEFDRMMVPYNKYQYKKPEFISQDFVSTPDIERLLKKKFQGDSLVKKTDTDIAAIVAKTANLINKIPNPSVGLNNLINLSANDSIFNDNVNTTNQQTNLEFKQTEREMRKQMHS